MPELWAVARTACHRPAFHPVPLPAATPLPSASRHTASLAAPRPLPALQVAAACGKSAEACEALYRRQHAYLSIPASLQSAQAFAALVEAAQKEEPVKEEPPASQQRSRSLAPGEDGGEASGAAGSRRRDSSGEEGEEEQEEEEEEPGLAAGRARRTPKRSGLLSPSGRVSRLGWAWGALPYAYLATAVVL